MVNTWFSSDTHFGHYNIIQYVNRPFKSSEQMNQEIIRKWNERVKPGDTVFFLGDFCFKSGSGRGEGDPFKAQEYIKQLNGNIIFIKGNHDGNNGLNTKIKSILIEMGGMEIFLVHNPMDSNNFYKLNLVGHVHAEWKSRPDMKFGEKTILINVGTDVWDFYPISFNQILEEYEKYTKKEP